MNIKNAGILTVCAIAAGTLCAPLGRAELVTNGGFCTGGAACAPNGDFNGWTTSAAVVLDYTNTTNLVPVTTYAAQIGAYYDANNPPNVIEGYIQQTLATVAGQQYNLTFLYGEYNANASTSGDDPTGSCVPSGCYLDPANVTSSTDPSATPWAQNNNLNVLLGGNSVYSDSNFFTSNPLNNNASTNADNGQSVGDYFLEEGTASFIATGASTSLEFDANDYQQSVIITGVSVEAATPEPGTIGLLGAALLGLGLLARRRAISRG